MKSNKMRMGILLLSLATAQALAQQTYVGRWDAYAGYTRIMQPSIDLAEPGFHLQLAVRPNSWITVGFDYTVARGRNILDQGMLIPSLAMQIDELLTRLKAAGLAPPDYQLAVPVNIRTQSFQFGPDFPFRHFKAVTFFARPNLGALQFIGRPRPNDPISSGIVAGLAPSGKKTDWTYFYGFGGGLEFNVKKHFALRFQADLAHDHPLNDILRAGYTIRFSVGPGFQWGKNVARR